MSTSGCLWPSSIGLMGRRLQLPWLGIFSGASLTIFVHAGQRHVGSSRS